MEVGLTGPDTGLDGPRDLVVDTVNSELMVANNNNNNSITVYNRTATGNTAPIRTLTGAATGLSNPTFVAVTPAQTRDFNGDGRADILWRHTSGAVALWFMNGPSLIGLSVFGPVGTDWTIVGVGDFNGDGRADILWRHTSGSVALWFMNGLAIIGVSVLGPVGTDWSIVGVGDFNGDGRADILWRHTSGAVALWFMNGPAIIGVSVLGPVGTDWTIVGVGG